MRRVFVNGIESVSEVNVIGHKLIILHLSFLHVSDEEEAMLLKEIAAWCYFHA